MTTRAIPVLGDNTNGDGEVTPTAEAELVVVEADLVNAPDIPVVALLNTPEATATSFKEYSTGVGSIPVVTLTAQHILEPEIDVESSGALTIAIGASPAPATTRAEFLSATVFKKTASTSLGISLVTGNDGAIYISKLQPDNPLANSPLRVGDKLLSLNNQSCADLNHSMAASLLRKMEGTVTVLVQNVGGDATLVETMVEKLKHNATVGISVARDIRGMLVLTKVVEDGLFAHSLVNTGDKVISINSVSCNQLDPQAAVEIIGNAPRYVTFLTRTLSETGVVVAVSDAPTLVNTNHNLSITSAERDQRDRESACKVCGILMVVFAVIVVAVVISVRGKRSACDQTVSYCFDCNSVDACYGYYVGQCCNRWVDTCNNDCNQPRSGEILSSYGV